MDWDEGGVGEWGARWEGLRTCDIRPFSSTSVLSWVNQVGAANDEETNEEAWKHGTGPETPAEALHVEDGRESAKEEGSSAYQRHKDGLLLVKANLIHQGCHLERVSPIDGIKVT